MLGEHKKHKENSENNSFSTSKKSCELSGNSQPQKVSTWNKALHKKVSTQNKPKHQKMSTQNKMRFVLVRQVLVHRFVPGRQLWCIDLSDFGAEVCSR